jgi:hypothetical protein
MSVPTLTPASVLSAIVLPITGTLSHADTNNTNEVFESVTYGIYSNPTAELFDVNFVTGAVDQVSYVYKKLGGDVLDIELTTGSVYNAYEEATLEYSYIINLHQATNTLARSLGNRTGSFDDKGNLQAGNLKTALGGTSAAGTSLRYPKFTHDMSRRVGLGASAEVGLMGSNEYSGSFDISVGKQDYDLREIFEAATDKDYTGQVAGKKITVKNVFYKTPHAMWRFYGYYGGLNVVGNLHNYGQFTDDATFQLVPVWENKSQAMAFEDAIYTRMSHFSYEIKNDHKLRIYPIPQNFSPSEMWVRFSVSEDAWEDELSSGVNNMNTLPLGNIPYNSINSIGKQWIRRYALALCKETLGQVRSKFGSVPIPGQDLKLNGTELLSQSKEEQKQLKEELQNTLKELTYTKLAESDASLAENTGKVLDKVPNMSGIYVG